MKTIILALLAVVNTVTVLADEKISKDTSGKYSFQYIHNFYNRTEDVVKQVGEEFLKKEGMQDIRDDAQNRRVESTWIIPYKGYKGDCFKTAQLVIKVYIYYKDNRSMIRFSDISYKDGDSPCPSSGTLEELTECTGCKNYASLLMFIRQRGNYLSEDYKKHLKIKSRDNKMF